MSTTKIISAIPFGYDGQLVTVECDTNRGLPAFNIVGLPNRTIDESRLRIKSAIKNANFNFPPVKFTINLAPAELHKSGAHLDLPIALSILASTGQLLQSDLSHRLFVGELALSGNLRPVRGIINIVEAAKKAHIKQLFLPTANAEQAYFVANQQLTIIPVQSLRELWLHLKKIATISPQEQIVKNTETDKHEHITLDQIQGQSAAKRAAILAVAGHHNILLHGPPGIGKTMLAQSMRDLLPPPSLAEQINITKLHSLNNDFHHIANVRPFRSPHYRATPTTIFGANRQLLPGEISLAHHGILFLDELPLFSARIIDGLRTPLEQRQITLHYLGSQITYPADFLLVAAMNPCPCGYLGSATHSCTCTPNALYRYRQKLSGPILDRIDMTVKLESIDTSVLLKTTTSSTHQDTSAKIAIRHALNAQRQRYRHSEFLNGTAPTPILLRHLQLTPAAKILLNDASAKLNLSARAYFKLLRVAQTIADCDQIPIIDQPQIAEALSFRQTF